MGRWGEGTKCWNTQGQGHGYGWIAVRPGEVELGDMKSAQTRWALKVTGVSEMVRTQNQGKGGGSGPSLEIGQAMLSSFGGDR